MPERVIQLQHVLFGESKVEERDLNHCKDRPIDVPEVSVKRLVQVLIGLIWGVKGV